ncbi:MAG: hypothetical protein ABID40_05700, partial [Candidatus Bipolaricaulota bacterium]
EKMAEVETLRISDELNIDLAPDGAVYGIELLNANEQLSQGTDGKLVFVDEEHGRTHKIALSPEGMGTMRDYHINILWSEEDGGYIADIRTWMAARRLPSDEALRPVEMARLPAGAASRRPSAPLTASSRS